MTKSKIIYSTSIIIAFISSASFALAWNNPTAIPPNSNGAINVVSGAPANTLYIASGGNMGIGTASPATILQLNGSGTAAVPATTGATQSTGHRLRLSTTSGTGILDMGTAGASGMWFQSTDSSNLATNYALLINPNGGNVGINKSGPTTALDVNGTVTATAFAGPLTGTISAPNVSAGAFGSNTGGGNYTFPASLTVDTNVLFVDSVNNRVGVGTIAPTVKLQSVGAAQTASPTLGLTTGGALLLNNTDPAYGLLIGVAGSGNVWQQAQRVDGTATAYNLLLQPSGGSVGIGTTAPLSNLHTTGTLTVGSAATAGSTGNVQITSGGASPVNNRMTFGTDGSGWKMAISKNQAGTVTDLLTIQDNGFATFSGNTNLCSLVSYGTGGLTSCSAGYYTWSGTANASGGYMLCCKVSNPI